MKKTLVIFLALSLVMGVFADELVEPVSDLNLVEFSGHASVTFGVDLDTGKTGFKNSTGVTLKLNLLPEDAAKSTSGDGIWGELVVKIDGQLQLGIDDASSGETNYLSSFDTPEMIIDVAQIHIYDFYVGIKSGDFGYGDDFKFPNALNFDNGDDVFISDGNGGHYEENFDDNRMKPFANFEQGLVLGYANDFFKAEASLRTNPNSLAGPSTYIKSSERIGMPAAPVTGEPGVIYVEDSPSTVDIDYDEEDNQWKFEGSGNVIKVTYVSDDDTAFWSNHYALGGLIEVTPIDGLKVGFGINYGISDAKSTVEVKSASKWHWKLVDANGNDPATKPNTLPENDKGSMKDGFDTGVKKSVWQSVFGVTTAEKAAFTSTEGDLGLFFGAQYKLPIGDTFSIEPVVAFNMYIDDSKKKDARETSGVDKNKYDNSVSSSLGLGLRFGWGEEEDDNSILNSFFAKSLIFNQTDASNMNENNDEDKKLLPGVSIYSVFDFTKSISHDGTKKVTTNMIDEVLPLMITVYSGEIVPNLKVAGMFYVNAAKDATVLGKELDAVVDVDETTLIPALRYGLQAGIAASYELAVGDVTITPAFGMLINHAKMESGIKMTEKNKGSATSVGIDVKVEVGNLVPNTTFTVAWEDSAFTSYEYDDRAGKGHDGKIKNAGSLTFAAKIAL